MTEMNIDSSGPSDSRRGFLGRTLEIGFFVASVIVCGAIILMERPSHDENMYVAAARLLGDGALYRDFAFVQAPYMPYIYQWVFGITGAEELLTAARLFKILITGATLMVLYRVCVRLSKDIWFALACCLLLVGNNVFRDTIPFAKNSDMAILFVLAAIWSYLSLRSSNKHVLAMLVSGLFIGLATGTRLTSLVFPLCFVASVFVVGGLSRHSLALVGYFIAGMVAGLIPALVISVNAGLDVAGFNNFGYHRINAMWRHATEYSGPMTLASKLAAARSTLLQLPSALILFLTVWLGVLKVRATGMFPSGNWGNGVVIMTLPVVSLIIFLIPTPAFMSYLSPLVIALVLLVCFFYRDISVDGKVFARPAAWCAVVVLMAVLTPGDLKRVYDSVDRQQWTSSKIHMNGLAIRSAIPPSRMEDPVATLNPLYALEGGLPIYNELATGPFAYRVGYLLSKQELRRYRTTSASDLPDLLDGSPPAAIVVGFEGELDSALVDYALSREYTRHEGLILDGIVFVNVDRDASHRTE